jgi:radical SAM protein with 4Fe4S-binding SPASM domain
MGWALRPDLVLQKAEPEGYVLLYSREPVSHPAPVFRLHPLQAMVLALFDGTRSLDELTEIVAGVFERTPQQARNLVDSVTRRYRQFLEEPNGHGAAAPVDPADLVFPTSYDFRVIREPAPVALMWVVTECCTKRCTYCYKDALFVADGRANDLTLSTGRMVELIDEAARIGVMTMVLSGGEPFLRPDLIDLIGVMVRRGMEVVPITKDRITGARMQALARTGLQQLHVSLDSHRAETVDLLTGVAGAFDQIVATVGAAAEYGVPVILRPVLSSVNARDFEGLIELAHTLQVKEVMADLYGESCGRHDEAFRVAPADYAWLRRVTDEANAKYPEMRVSFKFDHSMKEVTAAGRGCVEGSRGMTILPDGRVTKCEHWRFGEELTYGDLRAQSIMEAWQSDAIARLNCAPREAFAGTICGRCKKLQDCNERRGRCTLSALLEYRTPFAPDTYCPIGAFQKGSGHAPTA